MRPQVQKENPGPMKDVLRVCGQRWGALTPEEKEQYKAAAKEFNLNGG